MLAPVWQKNDRKATWLILSFSLFVFILISALGRFKLHLDPGFDVHIFARINAFINSIVTILLIAALVAVRNKRYLLHKRIMLTALVLSILFLLSYTCHHLFAGDSLYGDVDHNGILTDAERANAGTLRIVYLIILITHIPLAGLILPFVLFTAYRALIGEWPRHRRMAKITWPIWLYVAITGVLVYWMISPYY